MTDTAQPLAAESDGIAEAADAFKVHLGQIEAPERPRDANGKFISTAAPEEAEAEDEITEEAEAQAEAEAESDVETDEGEEAAEEAQPEAVDMPASWAKEDAEIWSELPPAAQARIAEREGQRDAAVNQKFQEAANLRKAHEGEILEARANRQRFAEAADQVLALALPPTPPLSMLDINSSDYDPDQYHLRQAQRQQAEQQLAYLKHQRDQISAQERDEAARAEQQALQQVNAVALPLLLEAEPGLGDASKQQAIMTELMDHAIARGVPANTFQDTPLSAAEWLILWEAKEYRKLKAATARVKDSPKPEPKKAAPPVRPGVTTPRSAVEQAKRKTNFDRLAREGSVEAGAAVFRDIFKGLK